MKRDMDLVLAILRVVENSPPGLPVTSINIPGTDQPFICEHVAVMIEHGLLKGEYFDQTIGAPPDFIISRLTWDGHEFLALAANEKLWNQVKTRAKDAAMGLSMHLLLTGLRFGASEWTRLAIGQIMS